MIAQDFQEPAEPQGQQELAELQEPQEPQEPQEKYLRPSQTAALLGVTPQTLREWHRLGTLSAIMTAGGQLRIPQSEVDRLLHRPPAPPQHQFSEYEMAGFGTEDNYKPVRKLDSLSALFKIEE